MSHNPTVTRHTRAEHTLPPLHIDPYLSGYTQPSPLSCRNCDLLIRQIHHAHTHKLVGFICIYGHFAQLLPGAILEITKIPCSLCGCPLHRVVKEDLSHAYILFCPACGARHECPFRRPGTSHPESTE